MGKNYDVYVTPQNTPRFRERRMLFVAAMGMLTGNLVVFACLVPEIRRGMLVCAVLSTAFTVMQYFENRKAMWTWWYILADCALFPLLTVGLLLRLDAYWYLAVLAAEILLWIVLAAVLLRPKYRKRKSARRK